MTHRTLLFAAFSLAFATAASAQSMPFPNQQQGQNQQGSNQQGGQFREPPPQAYTDCQGKKDGDSITITTPEGNQVPATCTNSQKGVFARPEHPPGGNGQQGQNQQGQNQQGQNQNMNQQGNQQGGQFREPPPQAYTDCQGKKAGDSITITTPEGNQVPATCTNSQKGVFARPEHPPGGNGQQGQNQQNQNQNMNQQNGPGGQGQNNNQNTNQQGGPGNGAHFPPPQGNGQNGNPPPPANR